MNLPAESDVEWGVAFCVADVNIDAAFRGGVVVEHQLEHLKRSIELIKILLIYHIVGASSKHICYERNGE